MIEKVIEMCSKNKKDYKELSIMFLKEYNKLKSTGEVGKKMNLSIRDTDKIIKILVKNNLVKRYDPYTLNITKKGKRLIEKKKL